MSGLISSVGSKSGIIGPRTGVDTPAFCATFNALTDISTGTEHFPAGTERFDQMSNLTMNTTGSTAGTHGMIFTAPVTGKYQMNVWCQFSGVPTNIGYMRVFLHTSNFRYWTIWGITPPNYTTLSLSVLADMDAGDIASPAVFQDAGTTSTDVFSGQNAFSGYLIA